MALQILTANRLSDGRVVYLAESGWIHDPQEARIAESETDAQLLLSIGRSEVKGCKIVDPYLIEVAEEDGAVRPVRLRERIRSKGPSIRSDLGLQAGEIP